jgi:hypothetical protein
MPWRRIREWRCSSGHSLTSALDGGEWSASRLGRFTPRERARGTHWIRAWVGTRASLDTVSKRKTPSSRQESNPEHPIVQPLSVAVPTELPRLTNHFYILLSCTVQCMHGTKLLSLTTLQRRIPYTYKCHSLARSHSYHCCGGLLPTSVDQSPREANNRSVGQEILRLL